MERLQHGPPTDVVEKRTVNSRRIVARRSPTSEQEQPSSNTAGSGEYRLGLHDHDSRGDIEVGLSVCSNPSPHADGAPPPAELLQNDCRAIADERGLIIYTNSLLPVGTRVALEIRLSAWTKLCVFGHVRWHRNTPGTPAAMGVGITLDDLPAAARCQLLERLGLDQSTATPSEGPNAS